MSAGRYPAELHESAQTTVQLYEQLQRLKLGDDDLRPIRAACGASIRLHAGLVTRSGRFQLAHCVGMASVLAAVGARAEVVAAGMVHSAYQHGDFGPWRVFLKQKRRRLRRLVGAPVEECVFRFHATPWNPHAVLALPARIAELDGLGRDAVLMRLANDLDSLRCDSILYHPEAEQWRTQVLAKRPAMVELAERLGIPAIGQALSAAIDEVRETPIPLQRTTRRDATVVPPESATIRLEARAARRAAGVFRRLRRAIEPRSEAH